MEWVFGSTFICKDMDSAKAVTFHNAIRRKSVTLDGDVFDPAGTLSGGSRRQGGNILSKLNAVLDASDQLETKTKELRAIEDQLRVLQVRI